MNRSDQFMEWLSIILLVVAGAAGVLVALLDFVGTDFENGPWRWLKGPLPMSLLIMGLLALAVGLERVTRFRKQEQRIYTMEQMMATILGGKHIRSSDEIYKALVRLSGTVQDRFRAFIIATTVEPTEPKLPPELAKAIVLRDLRPPKRLAIQLSLR